MNLKDKVVVITGASSGIGKELAFQLARKGSRVVLSARRADLILEHAERINQSGGAALAVPTDVSNRSQVEELIRQTISRFGRIDGLINNAGISPARGTLLDNSEADIRKTMEVNLMGCVYGVRAAVPFMEKSGGGQLVFVSSIIGKRGIPFNAAYCASKFALQGLTESIRLELRGKNIRVITACPAGVDTPFYENNMKQQRRGYHLHSAGKIARLIIQAMEKEKREVLLTMDAKLLHYLNILMPEWLDKAIAKAKGLP